MTYEIVIPVIISFCNQCIVGTGVISLSCELKVGQTGGRNWNPI